MKYIESNKEVAHIPYGLFSSSYNGCGWIAVWNYLHGCKNAPLRTTVSMKMEKWLSFGGLFGTTLEAVILALKSFNYSPTVYTKLTKEVLEADRVILYYGRGLRRHFSYAERHEGDIFKYKNPTIKAESLKDHEKRLSPTFIKYIIAERID